MNREATQVLDALARLLLLNDLQRERWVDVRVVGLTCQQVADRDGTTKSAVSLSVQNADRILASHQHRKAA